MPTKASPARKPISADSHVTEPPRCFIDHIEARYRDTAPHIERETTGRKRGDVFIIHGYREPLALGLVAAAGIPWEKLREGDTRFEELHRGGWDPKARLADQDRDGVAGEMIYPTIGMVLCHLADHDYKRACMQAYNRWLQSYVEAAPDRLFGLGMTAVRSVPEAIEDLRQIKAMGFKGVMLPGVPSTAEDYDDPSFDPLWEAAVALDLPVSFHIVATGNSADIVNGRINRGPKINGWQAIIRGCQDIIGMFIFSGVFERHPGLKLVCVEADAGWAPHFMYRMDHAYRRHRAWLKCPEMARLPSEYFSDNVYLTFQDDWVAFKMTDMCNPRRLMWANDFPHSDSTWPHSQAMLGDNAGTLSDQERAWILRDNVRELYSLEAA